MSRRTRSVFDPSAARQLGTLLQASDQKLDVSDDFADGTVLLLEDSLNLVEIVLVLSACVNELQERREWHRLDHILQLDCDGA